MLQSAGNVLLLLLISAALHESEARCGIPRLRHEALIRYGSGTRPGEWPWHAAILHSKSAGSFEYACGGTLINEEFVVTAAHCMYDRDTGSKLARRKLRVRLGAHHLEVSHLNTVREYAVAAVHISDRFDKDSLRNDIALVELLETVVFTNFILPACVSSGIPSTGDEGTVVGWGIMENDKLAPVLKKAVLPVVGSIDCLDSDRDFFGGMLHRNMFCAGFLNGTTVCNGDSGGGLFFKWNEVWFLGGIVSFSKGRSDGTNLCYAESYGGFTNVSSHVPWIQKVTDMPMALLTRRGSTELRLSDRKCLEYQSYRTLPQTWAKTIITQGNHTCLATLISEHLLLTTDNCASQDTRQYDVSATISLEYDNFYSKVKNLTLLNRSAGTRKTKILRFDLTKNVFGIGTKKNHDQLKEHVTCLWTDPEPITSDAVVDVYSPDVPERYWSSGKNVQLMDTGGGIVIVNDTTKCSERYMGAELRVKQYGEDFYRLVGPLIDCEPSRYMRLTPYLDQIEKSVWK